MEFGSLGACQHKSQHVPRGQANQANNLGILFVLCASVSVASSRTDRSFVHKLLVMVPLHDQSFATGDCRRLGSLDVHSSVCGRFLSLPCVLAKAEDVHNAPEDDSALMHTRRIDNDTKTQTLSELGVPRPSEKAVYFFLFFAIWRLGLYLSDCIAYHAKKETVPPYKKHLFRKRNLVPRHLSRLTFWAGQGNQVQKLHASVWRHVKSGLTRKSQETSNPDQGVNTQWLRNSDSEVQFSP